MKIKNVNFQIWCNNHIEKHDAKWCREVYPWIVFKEIDFDTQLIKITQKVSFNKLDYEITLLSVELQENKRYKGSFRLKSIMKSDKSEWEYRKWDTIFQLIFTQEGEFITVFTKKEDPSKDFVAKFMKANFNKISELKSRPLSELLFKSLVSYIVELNFPDAMYLKRFDVVPEPIVDINNQFKILSKHIYPLFSIDKAHWIFSSFTEEKAHRLGIMLANQCEKLTVVYCNPTYTRHHRCKYPNVEIVSLFDFFYKVSPNIQVQFEKQIIFLQNHLNIPEYKSNDLLLKEIENLDYFEYDIKKSELMEALAIMKIPTFNKYDAFYFFAGMNLINGWLSRKRKFRIQVKEEKLFKDMYFFKTYVRDRIVEVIKYKMDGVNLFFENKLWIIQVFNFQFSFHYIPIDETLTQFINSSENIYIEWSGKRLQPMAPLVFSLARNFKRQFYESVIKEGSNFS